MLNKPIFEGPEVQLMEVLAARDERAARQSSLLKKDSDVLISMTMNIPGPVKTSAILSEIFSDYAQQIKEIFQDQIIQDHLLLKKTGNEAYFLVVGDAKKIKKRLVQFEQATQLGRLFDLDVLVKEGNQNKILSRLDIDESPRRCFLCQEEAKNCARSRTHSVDQLKEAIEALISCYYKKF